MSTASTMNPAPGRAAISSGIDAIREDIGVLKSDVANVARDAYGAARATAVEVKDRAKAIAGDTAQAVTDRAGQLKTQASSTIEQHPLTSVGVALGVGFLLGLVLFRR